MGMLFITGPMSAGKTTELLRWYRGGHSDLLATSNKDTRDPLGITTHDGKVIPAKKFSFLGWDLMDVRFNTKRIGKPKYERVLIDEIQMFSTESIKELIKCAEDRPDMDFIVSGLTYDYKLSMFPAVKSLRALARDLCVMELPAFCTACGGLARHTGRREFVDFREKGSNIGGLEKYAPYCRRHHPAVVKCVSIVGEDISKSTSDSGEYGNDKVQ